MDQIYIDFIKIKRAAAVVTFLTQIIIPSADADVVADKGLAIVRRVLLYSSSQGSTPQSTGQEKIPATNALYVYAKLCGERRVSR